MSRMPLSVISHASLAAAAALMSLTVVPPTAGAQSVAEVSESFAHVAEYRPIDVEGFTNAIIDDFEWHGTPSITPVRTIGPLAMAILAVEAYEAPLERVRYRIEYGMAQGGGEPPNGPTNVSLIRIDRINLGPAIREDIIDSYGRENAPPPGVFGDGPHVSYRFAMSPIQGTPASINAISRAEMPDAQVASLDCFGSPCMTTASVIEDAASWQNERTAAMNFDQPYGVYRDNVISPAAAMDLISLQHGLAVNHEGRISWNGFEAREGVPEGESFAEAVIEINLGQEEAVDSALRDTHLMDHTTDTLWRRIAAVSMGPNAVPHITAFDAVEPRMQQAGPAPRADRDSSPTRPRNAPGPSIDDIVPAEALKMPAYRPNGAHLPPVAAADLVDCGAIDQSRPGGIIAFPNARGRNWTDAGMGPVTVGFVGCSNTFEANIQYEAFHGQDEDPTIEGFTMGGTLGQWEAFEFEERFWTAGEWTLVVFEYDAASGDRLEYDSVTFTVER